MEDTQDTPGDFNEGFTYFEALLKLDELFSELAVTESDLAFRAEVVTDPATFELGNFGSNIKPGAFMSPQAVRVNMDGTVLFFFSMLEPEDPAEAGWLFGIDYKGLLDVFPGTYKALVYNFTRTSKDSVAKVVEGNRKSVANRRRIALAINNALADPFTARAEKLKQQRDQAVQAHYDKSEDTGMF